MFFNFIYQGPEEHVVYIRSMSVALPIRGLRGDCRRRLHRGIKTYNPQNAQPGTWWEHSEYLQIASGDGLPIWLSVSFYTSPLRLVNLK